MTEKSNKTEFYKQLCFYSENKDYKLAILEWDYIYCYIQPNKCICGQAIKNNCVIKNRLNDNTLIVGNICINKFLEKDLSYIFKGIKQLDNDKLSNKDFIMYCLSKKYLSVYESQFLSDVNTKTKLSRKQKDFKDKIVFKLKNLIKY